MYFVFSFASPFSSARLPGSFPFPPYLLCLYCVRPPPLLCCVGYLQRAFVISGWCSVQPCFCVCFFLENSNKSCCEFHPAHRALHRSPVSACLTAASWRLQRFVNHLNNIVQIAQKQQADIWRLSRNWLISRHRFGFYPQSVHFQQVWDQCFREANPHRLLLSSSPLPVGDTVCVSFSSLGPPPEAWDFEVSVQLSSGQRFSNAVPGICWRHSSSLRVTAPNSPVISGTAPAASSSLVLLYLLLLSSGIITLITTVIFCSLPTTVKSGWLISSCCSAGNSKPHRTLTLWWCLLSERDFPAHCSSNLVI